MPKRDLSKLAADFLAKNPTLIGTVNKHGFYEHPTRGDCSPLIVITADGKKKFTDFWDLPTSAECPDFKSGEYA
jgi:hypothetical protein